MADCHYFLKKSCLPSRFEHTITQAKIYLLWLLDNYLFKKLGDFDETTNTTRFVNKDEFIGEYTTLFFKNGGDWCRNSSIKTSIYNTNNPSHI